MKLYEMPDTFVLLESKKEYNEYNALRKEARWAPCTFTWEEMKGRLWFCHGITYKSVSMTENYVENEGYKLLTFPGLKKLLRCKPRAKKPKDVIGKEFHFGDSTIEECKKVYKLLTLGDEPK